MKVTVGKSQTLYSSISRKNKNKNSGLLTVGAVNIDIPQHPVALHGMMTRGSKQLSSTLQVNSLNKNRAKDYNKNLNFFFTFLVRMIIYLEYCNLILNIV